MIEIAEATNHLLEKGAPFILATIVDHTGSTPRTSGSKMLITADGKGIGTIGGGLLEARVMSRAAELIPLGRSVVLSFDLNDDAADTLDMICGGQVQVLLDCVWPTEKNRSVFDRWQQMLGQGQRTSLLTIAVGASDRFETVNHCLVSAKGAFIGDFPSSDSQRKQVLDAAAGSNKTQSLTFDNAFVLVEPARRLYTAYLFGAGHVARSTAAVASVAGFRVSVSDDREEYANHIRFPAANEIRVLKSFEDGLSGLTPGGDDFIVIFTRGHRHDKTVLAQALKTDAGYIGMIGSRKKRNAIFQDLLADGFYQTDIGRVHSPIGLAISAETPEEIAVSIVAEMIGVRRGKIP